jgi:hypothetical protein
LQARHRGDDNETPADATTARVSAASRTGIIPRMRAVLGLYSATIVTGIVVAIVVALLG